MKIVVRFARFLMVALLCAGFLAPAGAAPKIVEADRIVAVVGNEVITFRELVDRQRTTVAQLKKQGIPLPADAVLQHQLLERMVLERIQIQAARETGIAVDKEQLDRAISQIAANNKLTVAQLKASLQKDGLPFDRFRQEIESEMMIGRLREREVVNKVNVTDAEADMWLAAQEKAATQGEEYAIAHILLRIPEGASFNQIAQIKARADQALARARKGDNFAELAASYSDAPDALQGGVLGWRPVSGMPTLFAEVVPGLAVGATSDVLRSANGFHLVKLLNKRGGGERLQFPPVKQTHVRHILIRVDELTSETDARQKLLGVRERLVNGGDFAELARLYSQDGSASKGGDLGWLYQGETVPDFEKVMDALKINELSQVVRSPFGMHLIQVLERRMQDVSDDRKRVAAKQALKARKAEEAYQDWLRQLRDRAYVDIRLDEQ